MSDCLIYKPLTLLVNPDIETLYQNIESGEYEIVSIGKAVSKFLITQEEGDRSQAANRYLVDNLLEKSPGPILCSDIDLLFHPSLNLDPLGLFKQISRNTSLIILWPGSYRDGVLSYAQPEHKHYRFWKNLEGVEIKGVSNAI